MIRCIWDEQNQIQLGYLHRYDANLWTYWATGRQRGTVMMSEKVFHPLLKVGVHRNIVTPGYGVVGDSIGRSSTELPSL